MNGLNLKNLNQAAAVTSGRVPPLTPEQIAEINQGFRVVQSPADIAAAITEFGTREARASAAPQVDFSGNVGLIHGLMASANEAGRPEAGMRQSAKAGTALRRRTGLAPGPGK